MPGAGASFGRRGPERRAQPRPVPVYDEGESPIAAIRRNPPQPKSSSWPIAVTAGVVFAASLAAVVWYESVFVAAPAAQAQAETVSPILIPANEMPDIGTDDLSGSAGFVLRYPRDPRSHLMRGIYFLEHKNLASAEQKMRDALAEPDILKNDLPAYYEQAIRITLAIILVAERRKPEAVIVAKPVCGQDLSHVRAALRRTFLRSGVCMNAA